MSDTMTECYQHLSENVSTQTLSTVWRSIDSNIIIPLLSIDDSYIFFYYGV